MDLLAREVNKRVWILAAASSLAPSSDQLLTGRTSPPSCELLSKRLTQVELKSKKKAPV